MTLTDRHRPAAAMERVRSRFPHAVELRFVPEGGADDEPGSYAERIAGRDDLDLCCGFLEHVRSRPAEQAEVELLRQAPGRGAPAGRRGAARLPPGRRRRAGGGRMRLHRLEVQAFGPFAERQRVDFDALAEGGLFLLHGPTGAGKTSVLDAVCFALYGRVPGARATASRLRSDHADPDLAPQVVCEFSVGPRRFELTRSPAWDRPKRRGEGTTEEKAKVVLRERRPDSGADAAAGADADDADDDGWRVLTQRVDEVAHLLDAVLGLSLDQFTKLVLLAQGEFAAFLRADAESRRAMLERLFDTERFTQLQSWLRDRQLGLRRRAEECEQTTRDLVARARQAAAVLPAEQPARPQLVQEELLLGSAQPVPRAETEVAEPGPGPSGTRTPRCSPPTCWSPACTGMPCSPGRPPPRAAR